jgi:hypothetical protein
VIGSNVGTRVWPIGENDEEDTDSGTLLAGPNSASRSAEPLSLENVLQRYDSVRPAQPRTLAGPQGEEPIPGNEAVKDAFSTDQKALDPGGLSPRSAPLQQPYGVIAWLRGSLRARYVVMPYD